MLTLQCFERDVFFAFYNRTGTGIYMGFKETFIHDSTLIQMFIVSLFCS